MTKTFRLGFSPCPNDTFMFAALVNNKVDTRGLTFEYVIDDVQQLNQMAFEGSNDVTKLSFFAYASVYENYQILQSGSALGTNCGPLLVSKRHIEGNQLAACTVAIPGLNTTAHLLLSLFCPEIKNKPVMLFSEIEQAVADGKVDAGLIIHESRFTYMEKGLIKIADLGQIWEEKIKQPLPLGCIAVKRALSHEVKLIIEQCIKNSVAYAFENTTEVMPFVAKYAQAMKHEIMLQHIQLYVNEYSVSLGLKGKKAIEELLLQAFKHQLIADKPSNVFVS